MAAAKNSAKPWHTSMGSLALPDPCCHLHPQQINNSSRQTEAMHSKRAWTTCQLTQIKNWTGFWLGWLLDLSYSSKGQKKIISLPVNHRSWKQTMDLLFPHWLPPLFFIYEAWDDKPIRVLFWSCILCCLPLMINSSCQWKGEGE